MKNVMLSSGTIINLDNYESIYVENGISYTTYILIMKSGSKIKLNYDDYIKLSEALNKYT